MLTQAKRTAIKLFAVAVAAVMALTLCVSSALAAGTGTIKITNASQGQTYAAYKLFDATCNEATGATAYTVKATDRTYSALTADGSPFVVSETADADGNYAVTLGDTATAEDIVAWVNDNFFEDGECTLDAAAGPKEVEAGNTVEFPVPYGYYFVTSTLGAVLTVDTNTPFAEVIDKNETGPTITTDAKTADSYSASVGDTVGFTVSFTATNFVTKNGETEQVLNYTIADTPTNMTIDTESIAVKVGDATLDRDEGDYTVAPSKDGNGFTLNIPWATGSAEAGYTSIYDSPVAVVVTYDATITEGAADDDAKNEATISYNSEPGTTSTVEVKTYSFGLVKTDGSGTVLQGAQFSLWASENGTGDQIDLVDEGNGVYRVADDEDKADPDFKSAAIEAGNVTIKGLGNGQYWLQEDVAPAGYNKLTDRKPITINDANNPVLLKEDGSYDKGGLQVINNAGSLLPSTGGMGTTVFYIVGGVLVAGAAVLLITRRRMNASK